MLTQDAPGASPADAAAFQARREKHSHANPFFLTCTRRAEHKADDFSPMSRFCKADLDGAIKEMQEILARSAAEEGEAGEGEGISETECRWVSARPPLPHALAGNEESISTAHAATPSDERPPSTLAIQPKVVDLPTHPTRLYDVASLTEAQFRRVWARGEPLVVEGLLDKFGIQWTPQYFKEKFGKQSCLVYDCQADKEKSIKTTVGQFFEGFGRYEGRDRIWKLKVRT